MRKILEIKFNELWQMVKNNSIYYWQREVRFECLLISNYNLLKYRNVNELITVMEFNRENCVITCGLCAFHVTVVNLVKYNCLNIFSSIFHLYIYVYMQMLKLWNNYKHQY